MAKGDNNQEVKTPTGEDDIRKAVETANAEDESLKKDKVNDEDANDDNDDDNQGDDAGSDDNAGDDSDDSDSDGKDADDEDEDEDDDAGDDKDKPGEKKDPETRRFNQFAGDGSTEAYLSNLEKGYENSSKEAIRLNTELGQATGRIDTIMRAVAADPELASKLGAVLKGDSDAGGTGTDENSDADMAQNPFVTDLKAQWTEKSVEEIQTFIEANPEVETDPTVKADVQKWMKIFSDQHYKDTGRLMTGGKAMAAAYKHLGLENKLEKQDLANGAKKLATPARSQGKAKKSNGSKPTFTSEQLEMARNMGKDEDWLAKNLPKNS